MSHRSPQVLALVLLACSHHDSAQTTDSSSPDPAEPGVKATLVSPSRDLLHKMNDHGVSFQGMFVQDWSVDFDQNGGARSGFGRYSFDLLMPVDGKKLFGLKGSGGMVRLKQHIREFGQSYDGAAQVDSNIDAGSRTTLYEIWIEQKLLSDRLRLKAGKIDANTEFAAVQSSGDFLNSSMGYSPTIVAFPTYPEPKFGVNAFLFPRAHYDLGFGVFQTAGVGTLLIVEPGHTWKGGQRERPGRMSFGYWRENGKMIRFDGTQASGAQGFYSVVEQSVWRQSLGDRGERKVSTFLQMGWAEGQVSAFTHHAGGGGILQGPFRKRSQDGIGVAATWVRFSSHPEAGFDFRSEIIYETYYKFAFGKHLSLAADFQYLHHPGGLRANPDVPVVTPRLVISF